jgi:chromosome segregation ATPase
MIRKETAKPLEGMITDLEGQFQCTDEQCDEIEGKKDHLFRDIKALEKALEEKEQECKSLLERVNHLPTHHEVIKVQGSQSQDPNAELPSKRAKGKSKAVPTASYSYLSPGASQAMLMVID